jgi:hypothetical protein
MWHLLQPAVGTCCSAVSRKNKREPGKFHRFPGGYSASAFFQMISYYMHLHRREITRMSAPLVVSIPHRLGHEEAMRRLKAGLTRAASSIPVLKVDEERWEENRMIFRVRALGQAASGHLDVADDHVRLEVTLPWLLQRFAEVAQAAIKHRGHLLLTKRG